MMDIVEQLKYWAFKFCGKGGQEDMASDVMTEAWGKIERLREEIIQIKENKAKVLQECRKNEIRHGEMIESLVNALARYEGHDELLKDSRTYLEIVFEGHASSKSYTDYKEWHKQRMDGLYEAYMSRARESRGK